MNIEPCKSVCHECGFLQGSQKGVLTPDVVHFVKTGTLFPCHLQLKAVTGSENQGIEIYVQTQETIKICRGYVISMYKSGIPPKHKLWAKLYNDIKSDDMSSIMSIPEALNYHERLL
jgi:hypothetical protein